MIDRVRTRPGLTERPLRALGWLGLVLACAALSGCEAASPRDWIIRFAPGDSALERNLSRAGVEEDWERIGTRIVSGSVCGAAPPRTERDVPGPDARGFDLRQLVARGEMPVSMSMVLAPGDYTVMAWAVDEHEALYAWSCLSVTSPGAGAIVSELRSVPRPIALRAEWRVSFADAATAASASRVFVRRQPGACSDFVAGAPPIGGGDRAITIPSGGFFSEPLALEDGAATAFLAWAERDADCSIAAWGCVDGPGPPVIETVLAPLAPAPSFCADPRACRVSEAGLACDHLVIEELAVGHTSVCFRSTESEVFCEGSIVGTPMTMPSGFVPERLFARHARRSSVPGSLDRGDGYCAMDAARSLVCWGDAFPFLTTIVTEPVAVPPSALPAMAGLPVELALGLRVGCVVMGNDLSGGTVYCQGLERDPSRRALVGGAGAGPWVETDAPTGVGNDISMLAAGAMDTCASNGTRIYCWGDERADVATPEYALQAPLQFNTGLRFTAVEAGEMHACGLGEDGLVQCWGSDFWGALEPRFELDTLPPGCAGLDYAAMVARPDCAGYALTNPMWDAEHGPRGPRGSYDEALNEFGAFAPRSPPTPCERTQDVDREAHLDCVLEVVDGLDAVPLHATDLALGAFHTCALGTASPPVHSDDVPGRVLCWGSDDEGDLGGRAAFSEGNSHGTAVFVRPCDGAIPSRDIFLEDIVDIEAGTSQTCAIDARGDVFCWGETTICAARPAGLPLVR